jgi:hypothetical protein
VLPRCTVLGRRPVVFVGFLMHMVTLVLVSYADTDHRYLFYLSFAALGLRDAAILVMLNIINSLLDTSNKEAAFGCTAAHRRRTRFSRLSATDGTGRAQGVSVFSTEASRASST